MRGIIFGFQILLLLASTALAETFTLRQTIDAALERNTALQISEEEKSAALAIRKARRADFLPTFSASYQYRRSKEFSNPFLGALTPEEEFRYATSLTQPVFTGFARLNRYRIASLGVDVAELGQTLTRQEVVFEAKNVYFSMLKSGKLLRVAEDAVSQIAAQAEVARNFYQVGMSPLNDLLQAEVELANARQNRMAAANDLEIAKSRFNTFLRRPLNAPVDPEDVLAYTPFDQDLEFCLLTAEQNRPELRISHLAVEISEKELEAAKGDYYPSVDLQGSYSQFGTDWKAQEGFGIIRNPYSWEITAAASWDFWEWGRTRYGVKERLHRLAQARQRRIEACESVRLDVKQAYLRTRQAEANIVTAEKAIEQAKENFRINRERYKEQVATATEVLDAQTLLSRTMTSYYSALYDFHISKASLVRAMGQDGME